LKPWIQVEKKGNAKIYICGKITTLTNGVNNAPGASWFQDKFLGGSPIILIQVTSGQIMKIKQYFYPIILTAFLLSPSAHADAWSAIAKFAGSLAGDVVKNYFRPSVNLSEVDILERRLDILEYKYKKFDVSKGKPYNYKEVGDLIVSLNSMTQALTARVGSLEGKYAALEQRVAALEKKQTQPHSTRTSQSVVPAVPASVSQGSGTAASNHGDNAGDVSPVVVSAGIDCATTTNAAELLNCYSPEIPAKDPELEVAYYSLTH
jgi:hypothetical protein